MGWLGRVSCARGIPPRATLRHSVRASIAMVLLLPHLAGCYHHVPASQMAMPSGTNVSVGITDRGRVALSELVGPETRRIDGRVLESTDSSLVLSVNSVQYLQTNIPTRWGGERLELTRDLVTDVRERRLSRSRTWIMAGLIAGATLAVSLIAIRGFGGEDPSDRPGGGEGAQQ